MNVFYNNGNEIVFIIDIKVSMDNSTHIKIYHMEI